MEPQFTNLYNYNEVLGTMNDILRLSNNKIQYMDKNPNYITFYFIIFARPLALRYIEVPM